MPNLVSSKKDLRRTGRRTVFNNRLKERAKRAVKKFNTLLAKSELEKAKETLVQAMKVIDKAAQKKVLKKETASRRISNLTKKLNKITTANNVETAKTSA